MSVSISGQVRPQDLKTLERRLVGMGSALGLKTMRKAAMYAMKPVYDELKKGPGTPEGSRSEMVGSKKGKVQHQAGFIRHRVKRKSRANKTGANKRFKDDALVRVKVGVFGVPYLGHIHYGTEEIEPNPFIERAWTAHKGKVKSRYAQSIKKTIATQARKK